MNEKCELSEQKQQLDYLVANLLEYFRNPSKEPLFLEAAKIALNQISRKTLSTDILKRRFFSLAHKLKNNISSATLRCFAEECFNAAEITGTIIRERTFATPPSAKALQKF